MQLSRSSLPHCICCVLLLLSRPGTYLWDYHNSFRALIFARDAPNVKSIEDMQAIIQVRAKQMADDSCRAPTS